MSAAARGVDLAPQRELDDDHLGAAVAAVDRNLARSKHRALVLEVNRDLERLLAADDPAGELERLTAQYDFLAAALDRRVERAEPGAGQVGRNEVGEDRFKGRFDGRLLGDITAALAAVLLEIEAEQLELGLPAGLDSAGEEMIEPAAVSDLDQRLGAALDQRDRLPLALGAQVGSELEVERRPHGLDIEPDRDVQIAPREHQL